MSWQVNNFHKKHIVIAYNKRKANASHTAEQYQSPDLECSIQDSIKKVSNHTLSR